MSHKHMLDYILKLSVTWLYKSCYNSKFELYKNRLYI